MKFKIALLSMLTMIAPLFGVGDDQKLLRQLSDIATSLVVNGADLYLYLGRDRTLKNDDDPDDDKRAVAVIGNAFGLKTAYQKQREKDEKRAGGKRALQIKRQELTVNNLKGSLSLMPDKIAAIKDEGALSDEMKQYLDQLDKQREILDHMAQEAKVGEELAQLSEEYCLAQRKKLADMTKNIQEIKQQLTKKLPKTKPTPSEEYASRLMEHVEYQEKKLSGDTSAGGAWPEKSKRLLLFIGVPTIGIVGIGALAIFICYGLPKIKKAYEQRRTKNGAKSRAKAAMNQSSLI